MTIDAALREIATSPLPIALVTVAKVSGSAPRHAGSRMAVRPDGSIAGTVGGGKPEAKAREEALACLAAGRNGSVSIDMAGSDAKGADLICGGLAEMWIELVADRSLYAAAVGAVDRGESVTILSSADEGCVAVLGQGGAVIAGSLREADGLLRASVEPEEALLILGGGHVGLALARAACALSFRVSVADPRQEYSESSRFPAGVSCSCASFVEAIRAFPSGARAYAVVVSPGHLGDLECARELVKGDYAYVGLIGSRRKSRMLIDELIAEGAPAERAESIRAPIGIDIGAETPEEIAVSIAAELVAVRRGIELPAMRR
jgi:xanthine dehydrogenase accessory factor